VVELALTFSHIGCIRCGALRQTRFSCPECDCKAKDTETDYNVQYRQRAARTVRQRADVAQLDVWGDVLDLFESSSIGSLIDSLFAAANRIAAKDDCAVDDLAALSAEFESLRRWAQDAKPLRPLIFVTYRVVDAIDALGELHEMVIRALEAESMIQLHPIQQSIQRVCTVYG